MATAKKSTQRTTASGRSAASSRRTSARPAAKPQAKPTEHFLVRMYKNPAGKGLLILAAVLIVIGIDFLLTLNHFERFFIVLGIEWIIATLVGWVLFVFRDRLKNGN